MKPSAQVLAFPPVSVVVRDAKRELSPNRRNTRRRIVQPKAKVVLLPGRFRGADYVKRHVSYVVAMDAERGEHHVQRNLDAIRRRLDEIGVDKRDADREVRTIEAAVRREIWRQVLLP
ncbi:DUF6074 family protein [Bradyrhizobium sp. NAS96.2]|uniref:DUF6074 family protein n=1 Tax=Bradyrhizobium sp. NAS96.2 TaxID=1680160 RepID=UPI00093F4B83|nr:DUF6074 family protein [Bradyrhizobium sp. NAS96.2]OKO73035.1 hypothetical protein AC628_25260 [Bradyrhizobium sp. NAS96.2]